MPIFSFYTFTRITFDLRDSNHMISADICEDRDLETLGTGYVESNSDFLKTEK